MFVTCLYALLDPSTGHLCYANAGHDLPYCRRRHGVDELRATGMPLGLMPGMDYEEKEITLHPGERILFYSDGLVEAHDKQRRMFGFPRLRRLVADHTGDDLIAYLLDQLQRFTGDGWQQEDDVTLVTLQCHALPAASQTSGFTNLGNPNMPQIDTWQLLGEWKVASAPGNERQAMQQVAEAVQGLALPPDRLEKLKTAVAEATMNAMEHGNHYRPDAPVAIQVMTGGKQLIVRITDQGGGQEIPAVDTPDLDLKLAGAQSPRGWGLFLIQHMVDEMNVSGDESHHTVELVLNLAKGADHDAT
jgi:anti-sigma regulatory factor (Ser/Thr protein kinase)